MAAVHHGGVEHAGVFVAHAREKRLRALGETSHTEHGITLLVDGWLSIEHGETLRAEAGDLTIVPAGALHRPLDGRDVEYWIVGFCAACVGLDETQPLMAPFRRVRRGALPVVHVQRGQRRALVRLFEQLRDECQRAAPESAELVRSLLVLILGRVLRSMPTVDAPAPHGTLAADALEFIQRECLSAISLRDVADAVHRTPTHVAATVKAETGYSVGQWIASGRAAEAASRLAHTADSLEAIAEHVGWRDKTHFIRQFKKAYGVTPAAWRRQQRKAHRQAVAHPDAERGPRS
jgi:AraC-like DNA-binding protein